MPPECKKCGLVESDCEYWWVYHHCGQPYPMQLTITVKRWRPVKEPVFDIKKVYVPDYQI